MSSYLSAELAATCSALGYFDTKSNSYYADENTLETVKDLIRYLRRDDETHDIRRQLGESKVLLTDLIPLTKSYWEQTELFDVLLRLVVNLTTPALVLWNEEIPTERTARNHYLKVEEHLQAYKEAFNDENIWAVLTKRISKILEVDCNERGEENSLIIERVLILIRNILYVPTNWDAERRTDNDASIHDQVLWALHQSGMLDIILFISGNSSEHAYYMHILEILSYMLREQTASELARAAVQRSQTEKIRDEAELLAIRHREMNQKLQKTKKYSGARHSRFGGTFVVKSMKSISDNELIYHKPLNKLDSLNFDIDKKRVKTPKNKLPIQYCSAERRSAFSIRLFLKNFCVEFLNGAYNNLMYHVKDNLVRNKAQVHDESYYLWAVRFFMEFNRFHNFDVKFISETMSIQIFHYVQQQMEKYFDMITSDKKNLKLWSRRLHLALLAYRELLSTICIMDKSTDDTVKESAKVIKSNLFYTLEYRELVLTLLVTYDELKLSDIYLKDLIETQHIFIRMLESFCQKHGSVVIQQKARGNKKKNNKSGKLAKQNNNIQEHLENVWVEIAPQLSAVLSHNANIPTDIIPFDASSNISIDDQKTEAMCNIQRKLKDGEFENAIGLLRSAREVWPENDCFGTPNIAPEEEFLSLRDIFYAKLGVEATTKEIENEQSDEEEDDEDEPSHFSVTQIKFEDFTSRLAHPKIVRACGLALKKFESNSFNTNHCIVKLLHRIAFDSKMYVIVFQLSILRTFQKIYTLKDLPQYKELCKFSTFIVKQYFKLAKTNKKLFMETLFWKSAREVNDITNGYDASDDRLFKKTVDDGCKETKRQIQNLGTSSCRVEKVTKRMYSLFHHISSKWRQNKNEIRDIRLKVSNRVWTLENEEELQQLFIEYQDKNLTEDVVDWICDNMIDNTRSRRMVLKKLKELGLLTDYKKSTASSKSNGSRPPKSWSAEEETQLRELFFDFKDANDPMTCIMDKLEIRRPKNRIIEKLLVMGLIQDKSEIKKKRSANQNKKLTNGNAEYTDSDDSNDEETISHSDGPPKHTVRNKKNNEDRKKKVKKTKEKKIPKSKLLMLLTQVKDAGMSEALEWLKESFSDAIEDYEDDGGNEEGIPLVPIMEYSTSAMDNALFLNLLKGFNVAEPFDEQEVYWRISPTTTVDNLKEYIKLISQAIDGSLAVNLNDTGNESLDEGKENCIKPKNNDSIHNKRISSKQNDDNSDDSDNEDVFEKLRKLRQQKSAEIINDVSINENSNSSNSHILEINNDANREESLAVNSNNESPNKQKEDNGQFSKVNRRIIDSDSDSNEDYNTDIRKTRKLSDSDTEKPTPKRSRIIVSDDED